MSSKPTFRCKNEAQKQAIRASYARRNANKPKKEDINYYNQDGRHFRGHRDYVNGSVVYHPNYIVGEKDDYYASFGITNEKKYDKKHNNILLKVNPKNGDSGDVYIHKDLTIDKKQKYTSIYYGYTISEEDEQYLNKRIEKWTKK